MQYTLRSRTGLGVGLGLAATLVVTGLASGTVGAAAADHPSGHDHRPAADSAPDVGSPDAVQLGPATKFVRDADGTIRRVR